jgi:hypothetical protein
MLIAFKLFITPIFIGCLTLAGRRWGPIASGLLMGLPLTSGPISFILAHQYGLQFASHAAIGNLVGQASVCIFCLTYSLVAQKKRWLISAIAGTSAFVLATLVWNIFSWKLVPAFIVLVLVIALLPRFIPNAAASINGTIYPKWDLPARMIIATLFVVLLTTFANLLGPQLSGLISPFPVFGVVLAIFTHSQQGSKAVSTMLRGVIMGSGSFACFYLIVGIFLTTIGIAWTYALASCGAIFASAIYYRITRSNLRLSVTH